MLESLRDKVAWVTGGGTGIGRAGAVALAGNGARLVLSGRRKEPLQETADEIERQGGEAVIEVLDVTDPDAVDQVTRRVVERFDRLDILVNNAGTNITERHWNFVTPEGWNLVVDTNLNGAFYCTRSVLPIMRRRKDGLIINISSWAGHFYSIVTGPAYTAAKHGLRAMNETINMEECVNGIRACVICPGEVWTPIIDRRPDALPEEVKATMLRPEDVGEAILFVARMPKRACVNELVISPAWNRTYAENPKRPGQSQ